MSEAGPGIVVMVAPVHDCRNPLVLDTLRGRIDPTCRRWILNPPDTIALEQALRIKDRFPAFGIRVVSVAPPYRLPLLSHHDGGRNQVEEHG